MRTRAWGLDSRSFNSGCMRTSMSCFNWTAPSSLPSCPPWVAAEADGCRCGGGRGSDRNGRGPRTRTGPEALGEKGVLRGTAANVISLVRSFQPSSRFQPSTCSPLSQLIDTNESPVQQGFVRISLYSRPLQSKWFGWSCCFVRCRVSGRLFSENGKWTLLVRASCCLVSRHISMGRDFLLTKGGGRLHSTYSPSLLPTTIIGPEAVCVTTIGE
mmetsp:Transcript_9576/g.16382  ORF Transcript_9576/g.16382 Transcript_9576/m.16382 type:complete len:214 (-) Transcript_9576:451-1092(-)